MSREETLVKAAILYYEDGLTQTQIAKDLNLSRPTIASMLQEAKDLGIVKISIQHPSSHLHELEQAIMEKYNLETVLVSPTNNKAGVGKLCADFMSQELPSINNLGIGWGTTVYEYVNAAQYESFSHLSIVPLMGGVGLNDMRYHSNHIVFRLSEKYNSQANYLYAPAVADNLEMKESLMNSNIIKDILDKGRSVDAAIVSVGNPIESSTYRYFGLIDDRIARNIQSIGAIGDILGTFFDKEGNPVTDSISERMIGLTIDDLKEIPNVVNLASGIEKAIGTKALLKQGVINHLIIDQIIAKELLK